MTSSTISTLTELSSEFKTIETTAWRMVEGQHHVSTLKITDDLDEQLSLEELLDKNKPGVPSECQNLDYLLFTPFRYQGRYPTGSRFRRAGRTLGVFYATIDPDTAVAELAFYRLLFYSQSPNVVPPQDATEYTMFQVSLASQRSIDLTTPPFAAHRHLWTHLTDYSRTQQLADDCRRAQGEIIVYESVRTVTPAKCIAALSCKAFAATAPLNRQTWRMKTSHAGVQALCEFPRQRLQFNRSQFDQDPRLSLLSSE
jgi:hypothetical protein